MEIAQGGFYMIHKAWTLGWGNADDLLAVAGLLEKIDASLVDTYAAETGQKSEEIADWMRAETWFSAQEAVDLGFADRIAADAPKAKAWNLAAYEKAPVVADEPESEPVAEDSAPDRELYQRRAASVALLGRSRP